MVVWHVASAKKLDKYRREGAIRGPVRAWRDIRSAERFSKQTGRRIILRLKFPADAKPYPGHRGEAVFIETDYPLENL